MTKIVPRQPENTLAVQMGRLRAPAERIDLLDCTIYWLTRSGQSRRSTKTEDCAMLVDLKNGHFRLAYYPTGEDAQVVMKLPLNRLPEAVADLVGAGFGDPGRKVAEVPTTPRLTAGPTPPLSLDAPSRDL